jgi:two-component system response regulator YesN
MLQPVQVDSVTAEKGVRKMRIVIVEENKLLRERLMKSLYKMNSDYEVAGNAADSRSGYELVRRIKPELIILDTDMSGMDGLAMLRKLRKEHNNSRVLILSSQAAFNHIKEAMELGAENYLLKPVKTRELKKTLQKVQQEIEKNMSIELIFSITGIFLGCLNGQLKPDMQFHRLTQEKYGFTVEDKGEVFMLWLGDGFENQKKEAQELLKDVGDHTVKFDSCVLEADTWNVLVMVLYHGTDNESQYQYFQDSVVPMLSANLKSPVICSWRSMEQIVDLSVVVREMLKELEWNLSFEKGSLIRKEDIQRWRTVPLKYPAELENEACHGVQKNDREVIRTCYEVLFSYCREGSYLPGDIKKAVIHFSWTVADYYKNMLKTDHDLQIQDVFKEIAEAVCWDQIYHSMNQFVDSIEFNTREKENPQISSLVQKARQMILKYYDQGITLEEVAEKLYVSGEYLSTQFKKQTGSSFSEAIREVRIERVKELLLNTHLKLNQIAELAGYADPKYMSKVFKADVGMLPSEFRKLNN